MIVTARLLLRRWRPSDRQAFALLNADPRVMEFLGPAMTSAESDSLVDRIEAAWTRDGFGLYATELRESGAFLGFIGLAVPRFEAHFTPCVEVGWRLMVDAWGSGLATEGARAVLDHTFETLGLEEVVSFTAALNQRSRRVMEKLGMSRRPADDFEHPALPAGHPLRPHVLYRRSRDQWRLHPSPFRDAPTHLA